MLSPPGHVNLGEPAAVVDPDAGHLAGLVEQTFCQVSAADAGGSSEKFARFGSVVMAHRSRQPYQ